MNHQSDLLRRALDAVRLQMPQYEWNRFAEAIVAERRATEMKLRADLPQESFRHLLNSLQTSSFVRLPMEFRGFSETKSFLGQFPVHKGPHAYAYDAPQMPLENARSLFPIVGYRSDQLLRAPGLIDSLNDPRLLDLIEAYLGCVPTLYSVNAWWSFPADKPELFYSQYYHRDTDDWRFVTLFIYLTDVGSDGGPHQVIPGSHSLEGMQALSGRSSWFKPFDVASTFSNAMGQEFAEECEHRFGKQAETLVGPAGTMFLVNTLALHRGLMPTRTPRLLMWARYGLGPTVISADREHGPIARRQIPSVLEDSPRSRYINRFLIQFESESGG